MIRSAFIIIFSVLIATLLFCSLVSLRSQKPIGRSICLFCLSLIPPVLGNMIIIASTKRAVATVGCYTYYLGMDLIMYTLIRFTNEYCRTNTTKEPKSNSIPRWVNYLFVIDVVQMLLNPFFEHAFYLQEIEAYGKPYFIMNPLLGQTFHRLVCYGAMAMVMLTFIIKCIRVPRLYKERYFIILISMIFGTLWQTWPI